MLSFSQARKIILHHTKILPCQTQSLQDALGYCLAQDVCADTDWPPFSRATMDGFAVKAQRHTAAPKPLSFSVVGSARAGSPFDGRIKPHEAIRISTGAMLAHGANCVIPKENVKDLGSTIITTRTPVPGQYFRRCGDDARKGDILIREGSLITPGVIALLASFGYARVKIYAKPCVGILVTGDELVDVHARPRSGEIRSANEYALAAQVKDAGGEPVILGRAKDTRTDLREKIQAGLSCDILLISGGVSVGDHDYVRSTLDSLRVRQIFWRLAVKPGKPLVFAKKKNCHVFGLPGNTVASMVSLHYFVRPCLWRMKGAHDVPTRTAQAVLMQEVHDPDPRYKIFRGIVSSRQGKLVVRLSADQISENVVSVAKANCFFHMREDQQRLQQGSVVTIEYFSER